MATERFFLELEPPAATKADWPHVVIVGGGFAGLRATHRLIGRPVRVTLIDKRNFNLFQPLLYQVATGLVGQADVASPLRQMVGQAPNVQVLLGEVEEIDVKAKQIVFNTRHFAYDHLILAAGSGSSYFGHEDWRPIAPPMKILEHANEIRRRVLLALEEAEQTPDPERRRLLQSVAVIGAGPTGCELAGSLVDLMRHAIQRDFKQLREQDCKLMLIDPGDRVLRAMHPKLSEAAGDYLQRSGVELVLGGRVQQITDSEVVLSIKATGEEQHLAAATVCWTAGVRASHLGKVLAASSGCAVDKGGRVIVEPDFSIPGYPEVRVVGDLCSYSHTTDGKPLPGMAGPAVQMGGWVANDILAQIDGQQHAAFRYSDFGSMAVVGPMYAVADLRGLRLSGLIGWLTWGLAHLAFMPEMENRLSLLLKWLWQIGTRERESLLIVGNHNQHMGVEVGLEHRETTGHDTTSPINPANQPPAESPVHPPAGSEP
ncbi:MAG: NAD(P)/FAD-dependent oxidoreductase [Cyanobacteria bacterium K_DeepCast_35m_m2_023]|nr:NAD(P)/FAD-dependent oxidoreductase [Cyanobacteria bacterium K_DeepCast_35m_m2_023]